MDTFLVLRGYLEARASFTEEEMGFVESMFAPKTLRAGDFLQRAGSVAKFTAFVAKGCLRSYVIDDKGKEHIIKFAPETWWLADVISMTAQTPSQYFIDAIENSEVLLIEPSAHDHLVETIPGFAEAFHKSLQKHAAAKDARIVSSMSASARERYLEFLKTYPSIVARVPQWMIASYLGVSPETVSRIRKKLAQTRC